MRTIECGLWQPLKTRNVRRQLHGITPDDPPRLRAGAAIRGRDLRRTGGPIAAALAVIADCESKLDLLDRELDERVAYAVTVVDAGEARERLVCMKFMIDLERIGDLLCSVASRIPTMDNGVDMADLKDLIEMAAVLEAMLRKAHAGLTMRDVDLALEITRADGEIDRHRNLLFLRLLDGVSTATRNAVHVLFIANALERAGDHAVNLGEEICHIVTGHSARHVRMKTDKPCEQRYLDFLRQQAAPHKLRADS